MRNFSVILAYIGIVIICIVLSTATYAYITVDTEEEIVDSNPTIELLNIKYNDTSNVSMFNTKAGDIYEKKFTITNVSGKTLYYDIKFINVANSFVDNEDLVYHLTSESGAYSINNIAPVSDVAVASKVKIGIGEAHEYKLIVEFVKKDKNQFENEMKTFFAKISINTNDTFENYDDNSLYKLIENNSFGSEKLLLENANEFDIIDEMTGELIDKPDYSNGIFYTNSSIDGNTIYFYKGDTLLNNNIILGENCYRIIRTTASGDVKLIYNGLSVDGQCLMDDVNVVEKLSQFNSSSSQNAYVGYMYGGASSSEYKSEHDNIKSSVIKIYLDSWYNRELENYKDMLSDDSVYCANRKTSSFTMNKVNFGNEGFSNKVTGYDMMNKYYNNGIINFDCENLNDRFSVSNLYGNAKLSNSVSLISVEELYYSGYTFDKDNTNHYLYSIYPYWTMTPAYFNKGNAYNYVVNNNKLIQDNVSMDYAIRPVITVKGDLKVVSGDGSGMLPYLLSR